MNRAVADRHADRRRLLGLAREQAERLAARLPVTRAAVVGSVARGDFNAWSDVDLVIVADGLPDRIPDRVALLMEGRTPPVQVIGFTPRELEAARRRRNRLVLELDELGVDVLRLEP